MIAKPLSRHLLILLNLVLLLPLAVHADRAGWNEPGRTPGYDQNGLLRIDRTFFGLSAATGGDFYFWAPGEFAAVAGLLNVPIASEPIALVYASEGGAFSQTIEVPVDGTISRLSLFAGSQRLDELRLVRPDGRTVEDNPAGVTVQTFTHMRIVTVIDPEPGQWLADINGSGGYELAVRYLAERSRLRERDLHGIDLVDFDFVELRGRLGHEGLFPVTGPPQAGTTELCRISLSGGVEQPVVELVSSTGDVLEEVRLDAHADAAADELIGSVRIPDQPFRVRVRGRDTEGWPLQRMTAGLMTPAQGP